MRLIRNTRPHRVQGRAARTVKEYIRVGISPRVHFHLEAVARTFAFFNGDTMITPDHIKAVAEPVLAHRLVLREGMEFSVNKEDLLRQIVADMEIPPVEIEEVFARFRNIKHGIKTRQEVHLDPLRRSQERVSRAPATTSSASISGGRASRSRTSPGVLSLRTYPEKLFRIERMEPKELRTVFVVDLSSSILFQLSQASSKAMLMLDLIGNIGLTRANVRDPVGLLGFSDRIETFVKPKLGNPQVFYIAKQIFDKIELQRQFPEKRAANFTVPFRFIASRLKNRHTLILISDAVDFVNDRASLDFKLLGTLAAKHDMMMLILDDPEEFEVRSSLGYIRINDMETDRQTVISARKASAIRRTIDERMSELQYMLKHKSGVDSVVLTPRNHADALAEFLIARTAR